MNLKLTEKQLTEIFNFRIGEPRERFNEKGVFDRYYHIDCPCGKSTFVAEKVYCNDINCAMNSASQRISLHIENKIRMRGCNYHINLLIKLIGKEKALELLEIWAKKNMIVALALKAYIQKLKEAENGYIKN